jgi:hypothetical protein
LQIALSGIFKEFSLFSLARSTSPVRKTFTWLLALLLVLGMIIQVVLVVVKFILPAFELKPDSYLPHYVSPNKMQIELRNYLGEGDVVLSDIYTAWSVPVYTGARIIALWHTSPHVTDNIERIKAVDTFYDTGTSWDERIKIVRQYGATHILLNFNIAGRELEAELIKMGWKVVIRGDSFCLFSVAEYTTE